MPNLFTFGCSYTKFRYPTYSDFLSPYFDNHFNLGMPGSGNRAIFNTVVENIDNITEDDFVLIQWSSLLREDRIFENNEWRGGGIITNTSYYNDDWVLRYFNPIQQAKELISYLTTLIPLIESKTKNFKWFYMLEPWESDLMGEPSEIPSILQKKYKLLNNTDLLDNLRKISIRSSNFLGSIESFLSNNSKKNLIYNFDPVSQKIVYDDHPCPYDHYSFSKHIIKFFETKIFDNSIVNKKNQELAIQWNSFVNDAEKMEEIEKHFFEKNNIMIDYRINNSVIQWPKKYV
jgi:hypothetical protein